MGGIFSDILGGYQGTGWMTSKGSVDDMEGRGRGGRLLMLMIDDPQT